MEDVLSKQILDTLRHNQAAATQILQQLMNPAAFAATPPGATAGTAPQSNGDAATAPTWPGFNFGDFALNAQKMMNLMFQRPEVTLENVNRFWTEQMRIYMGSSELAAPKDDRRFDDPAWRENPYYKLAMQTYLSLRQGLDEWVNGLPLEHKDAERTRFMLQLVTEALAPSNWPTNPAALKRYLETGGQSAIRGLQHMVDDLVRNHGMPSMVKRDVLKVGVDMATSPGKVVHRGEVFELIQYAPATDQVHARPYLMVPPQINKYYFYDLSPKKSLIRFAVESGLQTFAISWRNPGPQHSGWNFDTYISAVEEAVDVVRDITGSPDVNIEGGCVAGLDVVALLADLARRGEKKVHCATLMVTMLDTSVETQLNVMATPATLEMARNVTKMKGLMEGSEMGRVFAFLRPNDLVWNYYVNNYLLGNEPPTFDVLAWNADTVRISAGCHVDLLNLVEKNTIVRGEFKVRGEPIDVGAIDCDQFWLAGLADHITPWAACYASSQLLGGKREFIVSDGGHIQSMISSPGNPKAKYFVNKAFPATAEAWLAGATEHERSWWLHWRDWIKQRSGKLSKARKTFGNRGHRPLGDAPGTYVFE